MAPIARRLADLERALQRRDVPPIVVMELPLSVEDETAVKECRRRGSIVLALTADDMRL